MKDIKIIFFDIDGTLIAMDQDTISEKTLEALQKEFGIDMEQLIGCFHYASEAIDTATNKTYKFSKPKNGAWIVFPWE